MLAVVQDQQHFPLADRGDEPTCQLRVRCPAELRCPAEQSIPEAEGGERRLRHITVPADGGEIHQPGPVRQVA